MKLFNSNFLSLFLFLMLVFIAVPLTSCEKDPEPVLTKPTITLKLSEESPQNIIILSWIPSDDADLYGIERTMVRDGKIDYRYFNLNAEKAANNSYTIIDDTCESGTEYTYVASVEKYYHDGGFYIASKTVKSEPQKITTASDPNVTLDYPRNVKVEPAANVSNALTVSWNPVTNAQEYEIYFSGSRNSDYREQYQKIATTTQTSYTKENLANLSYYYFMIKAINGDEYSLYSATAGGFVPRE